MKKRKNIWLGLSLAAVMMMGLGGCAKGSGNAGEAQQTAVETTAAAIADTTAEASQETDKADSAAGDKAAQAEGTRIITDSAGREVEILRKSRRSRPPVPWPRSCSTR